MLKKLICLVIVMALASTAQALYFSDGFDYPTEAADDWTRVDYQAWYEEYVLQPMLGYQDNYLGALDWCIGDWDGYQSIPDAVQGITPTQVAYNYADTFNYGLGEVNVPQVRLPWPSPEGQANGVLSITSAGSFWSDADDTGPFLYKLVAEDFIARVEVVGQTHIFNNLGGLMARAPGDMFQVDSKWTEAWAAANENWVYLTYFPLWDVGNHIRNTVNSVSTEMGSKGYPCDPYLELRGDYDPNTGQWTFKFLTSPTGELGTYVQLPGLEGGLVRDDLPPELQVGVFQANYAPDYRVSMEFDNFSIVPEPATIALLGLGGLVLLRRKRA